MSFFRHNVCCPHICLFENCTRALITYHHNFPHRAVAQNITFTVFKQHSVFIGDNVCALLHMAGYMNKCYCMNFDFEWSSVCWKMPMWCCFHQDCSKIVILCSVYVRPSILWALLLTVCIAANEKLLRAIICAGLYPNVAKLSPLHKPNR